MSVTTINPSLNSYITDVPKIIEREQKNKAMLYNVAAKICLVAFLAIGIAAIAISLSLAIPISPLTLSFLCLSTIPLQFSFQIFMARAISCRSNANIAEKKGEKLVEIQSWSSSDIKTFFKSHQLSLKHLPFPLLAKINPEDPLQALLPAIAAYEYFVDQTDSFCKQSIENLNNTVKHSILKLEGRRKGWQILENQALPSALQAAFCLQVISHPTLQMQLNDIGTFCIKKFDERVFDQLLEDNDEYFIFQDKRPALTLKDLGIFSKELRISLNDVDILRAKLFND
ncbi:MAG TPA: hypothetical protein VLE95_00360 [Chlamydiales bacterium]|nr:hypothetical protein [Chlamydiales bacterium]